LLKLLRHSVVRPAAAAAEQAGVTNYRILGRTFGFAIRF
jgi:hypothetical protein